MKTYSIKRTVKVHSLYQVRARSEKEAWQKMRDDKYVVVYHQRPEINRVCKIIKTTKAQVDGLVKAANVVISGIDKNHERQNQGDNPHSFMAGNSIRYEVPWDKMTELCNALHQFSATEI